MFSLGYENDDLDFTQQIQGSNAPISSLPCSIFARIIDTPTFKMLQIIVLISGCLFKTV